MVQAILWISPHLVNNGTRLMDSSLGKSPCLLETGQLEFLCSECGLTLPPGDKQRVGLYWQNNRINGTDSSL